MWRLALLSLFALLLAQLPSRRVWQALRPRAPRAFCLRSCLRELGAASNDYEQADGAVSPARRAAIHVAASALEAAITAIIINAGPDPVSYDRESAELAMAQIGRNVFGRYPPEAAMIATARIVMNLDEFVTRD